MNYRYRSFFWPAVLIVIGVFALLVNSGLVPLERLDRLADLWPLILVVIGLELLVRRALQGAAADVAAALIVLLAVGGAAAYVALGPSIPAGVQTLDSSANVGSISHATARVDAGGAKITMRGSGSIGDDLYRAHIEYSGSKPDVGLDTSTGELHISQSNTSGFFFQNRRFALDLQLNPSVRWKIIVDTGASSNVFMLTNVQVASIELNTGASKEDISLGAPAGKVPISINGGALTVNVHRPPGIPARAAVSGVGVSLSFDGRQTKAFGTVTEQTGDYGGVSDKYQIEIDGGACNVTVDTRAPTPQV